MGKGSEDDWSGRSASSGQGRGGAGRGGARWSSLPQAPCSWAVGASEHARVATHARSSKHAQSGSHGAFGLSDL